MANSEISLEKLIYHLIGGSGKMKETNVKNEDNIIKSLAKFVKSIWKGENQHIYLPIAWPLKGFGGLEEILNRNSQSLDSQEVLTSMKKLIIDLINLNRPYIIHRETFDKCRDAAKEIMGESKGDVVLAFINKYFTINKDLFREVLNILYTKTRIKGVWEAIEISILRFKEYSKIYEVCKNIRVGSSKDDTAVKRMYAIARFYDNLLIITASAAHEAESFEELKFGKGRRSSYTLYPTPFTKALNYVLDKGVGVDDYVEAYEGFVRTIIEGYINKRSPEEIVGLCLDSLKQYKHIDVSTDEKVIRPSVEILLKILDEIQERGYLFI